MPLHREICQGLTHDVDAIRQPSHSCKFVKFVSQQLNSSG